MKEMETFENCDNVEVTLICEYCGAMYSIELSERQNRFLKGKLINRIHELESEVEKYRSAIEDAKKERNSLICENHGVNSVFKEKLEALNKKYAATLWEYCDSVKKTDYDALEREHKKALKQIEHDRVKIDELINEIDCKRMELPPEEPIGAAAWLINAKKKRKTSEVQRFFYNSGQYEEYDVYSASDLREIAEHLLAYCKNNESEAYASEGEEKC